MGSHPIIAIDASLKGTAVAYDSAMSQADGGPTVARFAVKDLTGVQRLAYLRDTIIDLTKAVADDHHENWGPLVLIEGYSYGSKGQAVVDIGELGGVLRLHLFEHLGYEIVAVAPGTIKKFATGNGGAGKAEVVSNVSVRVGRVITTDDEADATALYCIGRALLGLDHPMGKLPKTHLTALVKCPPLPGGFT